MRAILSITSSTATSELSLAGVPLVVRVDRRARRLRLRVDRRGSGVVLTVPAGVSRRRALEWAGKHEDWASKAIAAIPRVRRVEPGATIMFRGEAHLIDWSPERPRFVRRVEGRIECGGPAEGLEARVLRWLRGEALTLLTRETRDFAGKAGARLGRVSIGDARSRWGSCSASGNIRYSWRLVLAPDFVRRATVAHEAAHLVHMNHAPEFHALAEQLLGCDPAPAREWLRRHGASLYDIG